MPDDPRRQDMMRLAGAGVEFIVTIGLLIAGGIALDRRLGTKVAFTIAGACGGFALAMVRLVRQARSVGRNKDKDGKS